MPLVMNEMGELYNPDDFDEGNRLKLRGSVRHVRERESMKASSRAFNGTPYRKDKTGECAWCGEEFTKNAGNQLYCSPKCSRMAQKKRDYERSKR